MAFGLSRRTVPGMCLAVAATPLAYRGLAGSWPSSIGRSGDTRAALSGHRGIHVRESIRLERPLEEVYRFWRRLENLPQFMTYLEQVTELGEGRSRWVARGPAGIRVTWDAEIINDVPNSVIGWRSLPGSEVVSAGSVNFDPARAGRSTQVTVHLQYAAPAGRLGAFLASVFGREPSQTIREDLRRLKQLLEAGEIARTGSRRYRQEDPGMKAVCYYGKEDIRVETVPDPAILNPRDAIVKITATAICGSDLHIFGGYIPTMEKGDVLGHEFMGEVVEVGRDNTRLRIGDRVVVPFTIACGRCYFCKEQLWSLCDNSNPNAWMAEQLYGSSASGLFGYSHMYGGYPGGQAEYARVPFADVGPLKVPASLTDEQVLFLSDIFPTGYMAADNCQIKPGDTVAVWGCGPVGQFAIQSAFMLGAERVIAIDRFRRPSGARRRTQRRRGAQLRRSRRAGRAAHAHRRPGAG